MPAKASDTMTFCQRLVHRLDNEQPNETALSLAPQDSEGLVCSITPSSTERVATSWMSFDSVQEAKIQDDWHARKHLPQHSGNDQTRLHSTPKRRRHNMRHSPLVKLPAELRQMILYYSASDAELKHGSRLGRRFRTRACICTTLRDEMDIVRRQWLERRRVLREMRVHERPGYDNGFGRLMQDYMAPIHAAAVVIRRCKTLSCEEKRKERKRAKWIARRGGQS
ncbi:hypothetical protein LTR86_008821 [Recurvomyces mirabilis]|nr:hypothetical protein LTR86_008821 [Recurvomyces mirabilis]